MRRLLPTIYTLLFCLIAPLHSSTPQLHAQDAASLFKEIGEALQSGDSERLAKWFASNLELDILDNINVCSKNQAKQIIRDFYAKYTPKSFQVIHQSGTPPMRYAIGNLSAGGETFRLTLFVHSERQVNQIRQIRIEKN